MTALLHARRHVVPPLVRVPSIGVGDVVDRLASGVVRVASLNVAHGRRDLWHQLLQRPSHRRETLLSIARVFARERPHVVGLQEADGPSFWSGRFCHLSRLAVWGGFPYAVHGAHVQSALLRYGTGLLSVVEPRSPLAFTFDPSPPTFSKGFTLGSFELERRRLVDVVSVHLDFASSEVRARQVQQMAEVLRARRRPLVVMGDFNAGWRDERSAVRALAARLELVAHEPHVDVATFPSSRARLDWILISPDLAFERYEVLSDVVSDHLPVIADVRFR